MPKLLFTPVVAYSQNRVIGRDNGLPWKLKKDLKHFKEATMGKPLLMGRKTYESIGRPLPGREMIVLTRDPNYIAEGCQVIHRLDDLYELLPEHMEVMVGGGAQIYEMLLPHCQKVLATEVLTKIEGDTYFPELNPDEWEEISRDIHCADEDNEFDFAFVEYIRKS